MLAYGRIPEPRATAVEPPIRDLAEAPLPASPLPKDVCERSRRSIAQARGPLLEARSALTKRLANADLPGEARLYLENALDALNKAEGRLEAALARLGEAEERLEDHP